MAQLRDVGACHLVDPQDASLVIMFLLSLPYWIEVAYSDAAVALGGLI